MRWTCMSVYIERVLTLNEMPLIISAVKRKAAHVGSYDTKYTNCDRFTRFCVSARLYD
jgi:hypothetical protein